MNAADRQIQAGKAGWIQFLIFDFEHMAVCVRFAKGDKVVEVVVPDSKSPYDVAMASDQCACAALRIDADLSVDSHHPESREEVSP
jgi:hypothetical protein